jgi:hypothetical protein
MAPPRVSVLFLFIRHLACAGVFDRRCDRDRDRVSILRSKVVSFGLETGARSHSMIGKSRGIHDAVAPFSGAKGRQGYAG